MVAPLSNPATPNPSQLMARLRMMPDSELFQYAQMHQSDPYIFPLTFQESNARKAMRAAQYPQAAPAPKVVQQDLAQMAPQNAAPASMPQQTQTAQAMPEDQGIGTLPAPNMERMAGGGIIAFDEGGEVPGYAEGVFTKADPKQAFATKYHDAAVIAGQELGVDPGIIISQWGLETGWGKSIIPNTNNLGNIKDFSGKGVKAYDKAEKSNDRYRQYGSPEEFAKDYASLIKRKYPEAVGAGGDAKKFVTALRPGEEGGYATDKNYSSKFLSTVSSFLPIATATAPGIEKPAPTPAPEPAPTKRTQWDAMADAGRGIVGAGETALQYGTGLLAVPTAGVAALMTGSTPAERNKKYAEYADQVTYSPRTEAGQNISEATGQLLDYLKIPAYIGHVGPTRPIPRKAGLPSLVESGAALEKTAEAERAAKVERLPPPKKEIPTPSVSSTPPVTSAEIPLRLTPPNEPISVLSKETIPVTPEGQGIVAAQQALEQKRIAQFEADKLAAQQKQVPATKEFPITPEAAAVAEQAREMRRLRQQQADIATATAAKNEAATGLLEAGKRGAIEERMAQMERENQGAAARAQALAPAISVAASVPQGGGVSDLIPETAPAMAPALPSGIFAPVAGEEKAAPEGLGIKDLPKDENTGGTDWNSLMLKMGLHLMAGKSPNAMTNIGEAGLGALSMQQAEEKAKSESEYRKAMGKHYTMPSSEIQMFEWARDPKNMQLIKQIAQAKADPKASAQEALAFLKDAGVVLRETDPVLYNVLRNKALGGAVPQVIEGAGSRS